MAHAHRTGLAHPCGLEPATATHKQLTRFPGGVPPTPPGPGLQEPRLGIPRLQTVPGKTGLASCVHEPPGVLGARRRSLPAPAPLASCRTPAREGPGLPLILRPGDAGLHLPGGREETQGRRRVALCRPRSPGSDQTLAAGQLSFLSGTTGAPGAAASNFPSDGQVPHSSGDVATGGHAVSPRSAAGARLGELGAQRCGFGLWPGQAPAPALLQHQVRSRTAGEPQPQGCPASGLPGPYKCGRLQRPSPAPGFRIRPAARQQGKTEPHTAATGPRGPAGRLLHLAAGACAPGPHLG